MAIEIIVPRLGWSMEEGAFVAWLKQDGDYVRAGDPLFRIEGDKAVQDIESIDSGVLRIAANGSKPGDPIRVGVLLGHLISAADEVVPRADTAGAPTAVSKPSVSPVRTFGKPSAVDSPPPMAPVVQPQRAVAISPRALRLAAELGVDWSNIQGSGRNGRIREIDIRTAAASPIPSCPDCRCSRVPSRWCGLIERALESRREWRNCCASAAGMKTTLD